MKAHGDVDSRVHIYKAKELERGRVASPTLYPRYSFYGRLSGYEGVKKISTPSTPGIEPGPPSP